MAPSAATAFKGSRGSGNRRNGGASGRLSTATPETTNSGSDNDLSGIIEAERRRGRGAQSNASGRYEPLARVPLDDGWQSLEDLPPFKTTVSMDATRRIIARNDSPDISFDRSINP